MRIGKRILALLCTAAMLLSLCGGALAAEEPPVYTLTKDDCTYTLSDSGAAITKVNASVTAAEIIVPDELDGYPVTVLGGGNAVFAYPTTGNARKVTLPQSLVEIGAKAFSGCNYLAQVNFPSSLKTIGERAFAHCYEFKSLALNEGLEVIGKDAFTYIGFDGALTLPDSLISLGDSAFSDSKLTSIASLGTLTALPAYLFSGCNSLSAVTLPDNITSMGTGSFFQCEGIESVVLPDGMTELPDSAFNGCTALASVTLPSVLSEIGSTAFAGCSSLKTIELPASLEALGSGAFKNCTGLTSVAIPDGVTKLNTNTFSQCWALQTITLPGGLTEVKSYAFEQCKALQSMTFPASLSKLSYLAFNYTPALREVIFEGAAPDTSNSNPLGSKHDSGLTVYYPAAQADSYETWKKWTTFSLKAIDDKPAPLAPAETTITLSAFLEHSRQDELMLWCTVDVTPTAHPEDPTLSPAGPISFTLNGGGLSAPINFVGGATSTHQTIGYPLGRFSGSSLVAGGITGEITVQAHLADSIGFKGSDSNSLTGKVVGPKFKDDRLPFLPEGVTENTYETVSDGEGGLIITGITGEMANRPEPIIPAKIGELTVTGLGDGLFAGNRFTTYVTIPNSVKNLGKGIFKNCPALFSVTLPSGLTTIPEETFSGCGNLGYTGIPKAAETISANAYRGCTNIETAAFPASLRAIDPSAFTGCSLASVTFEGNAPAYGVDSAKFAFGPETILYTAQGAAGFDAAPWADMRREPVTLGLDFTAEFQLPNTMLLDVRFDDSAYQGTAPDAKPSLEKVVVTIDNWPIEGVTIADGKLSVPVADKFLTHDAFVNITYPAGWYFTGARSASKTGIIPYERVATAITGVTSTFDVAKGQPVTLWLAPTIRYTPHPGHAYTPTLSEMKLLVDGVETPFTVTRNETLKKDLLCLDATQWAGRSVPISLTFKGDYHFYASDVFETTLAVPAIPTDPPPAPVTKLSATAGAVTKTDESCFLPLTVLLSVENPGSGTPDRSKLSVTLNGEVASYTEGSDNLIHVAIPEKLLGAKVKVAVRYAGQTDYAYQAASAELGEKLLGDPTPPKADTTLTAVTNGFVWNMAPGWGRCLTLIAKLEHAPHRGDNTLAPSRAAATVTLDGKPVTNFSWSGDNLVLQVGSELYNKNVPVVVNYLGDEHFNPSTVTLGSVTITPPAESSSSTPKPSTSPDSKVTVSDKTVTDAVKAAVESGSVVLKADAPADAKSVAVTVSASAMSAVAKADAPISLQTPVADLKLDVKVLEALQADGTKDVVVSAGVADRLTLPQAAQDSLSGRPVYDISITSGGKSVSQFGGGSVTVALPYTLTVGEDPACLTACWVREDGTTEILRNSVYQDGKLVFSTPHLSTYAIVHTGVSFLDVEEGSWAKGDIGFTAARGMLGGVGNNQFGPAMNLTGNTAVTALARMDGVADGTGSDWAAPALAWAEEKGILPAGFEPDALMSREQFASLVTGYLGGAKKVEGPGYTGAEQISSACLDSVNYLASLGVMKGTGDGRFAPHAYLTRSELAAVLHRMVVLQIG